MPSRLHPGRFYALPQAPQQFKQLIMVAGFDRYFQIAPCFRDEDPRADRLPGEFYQIDVEMSFVTQEDVFQTMEPVIRDTFADFAEAKPVTQTFPRIKYADAMLQYGSDKPDLRNPLVIVDVSEVFAREDVTFNAFKNVVAGGGVVRAIPATGAGSQPRSFFDKLNDWARTEGAPGLGYIVFDEDNGQLTGKGPIAKFIPAEAQAPIAQKAGLKAGDAVFFAAGEEGKAASLAGKARVRVGDELGLGDKNQFAFCWITDFPQYEWNEDEKKIDFSHNPFSMANMDHDAFMALDPSDKEKILSITALQYDMVCNGYEMASGSIRNHRPDRMVKAFEIAGYGEKEVMERSAACSAPSNTARPAWRHGGGDRPHRHAALRGAEPAGNHHVPDEPARRGPAARSAFRGDAQATARTAYPAESAGEKVISQRWRHHPIGSIMQLFGEQRPVLRVTPTPIASTTSGPNPPEPSRTRGDGRQHLFRSEIGCAVLPSLPRARVSSRSSRPSRSATSATWRWPIRRAWPPPARPSRPIRPRPRT